MKKMIQTAVLLLAATATAQVPELMNYQGRLVDGTNLLSGAHTIEFFIYTNSTGGEVFYAETDGVSVDDGFYSTELGDNPEARGAINGTEPHYESLAALLADEGTLYLELEVDGTTLTPRERILSSAFAMVAAEAQGVAFGSITSSDIANGTISSLDIANGTISRQDLAAGLRNTLDSGDGSVAPAVSVDDDGNLGVGTTAPVAGLQVSTAGEGIIDPVLRSVLRDSDGTFTNLLNCRSSAVKGDYAYIAASSDNAITVVNISDPDSPVLVTTLKDGVGGFDYLGGVYSLVIDGNYLYAGALDDNAVTIINISSPASPTLVTQLVDGFGYNYLEDVGQLCKHNDLLFIPGLEDAAVTIVDVSSPAMPLLQATLVNGAGGFTNLYGAYSVAVEGDYLYIVALYDQALTIADISNPASPQFVADIRGALINPEDVAVRNGYVYIPDSSLSGLAVLNCQTPASPEFATVITNGTGGFNNIGWPLEVSISNTLLYVGAYYGVTVADISDPVSPRVLAELIDGQYGFDGLDRVRHVLPVGDRLYISAVGDDALTIADISATNTSGAAGLFVENRVGIGTPIPREALDVRGNIVASGNITAENNIVGNRVYIEEYVGGESGLNIRVSNEGRLYTSISKSGAVSVSSCAFQSGGDGSVAEHQDHLFAYMDSGTANMYAPVCLPDGAVITSVRFYYYDDDVSSALFYALRRGRLDITSFSTLASGTSSDSSGRGYELDDSISYGTVDNGTYAYHLDIYPASGSWSTNLRFTGARIYYTIDD